MIGFTEQQKMLAEAVRKVAQERVLPRANEIDARDESPYDLRKLFAELGYFGIGIPREYGGGGADFSTACIVTEEIAKASAACALMTYFTLCVPYMPCSEEQKARIYPVTISGEKLLGFAITEPNAGSDVAAIETRAIVKGDHYILNGTKIFQTGAGFVNGSFTVVKTDGGRISLFLIEEDIPGFELGRHDERLGLRGVGGGEIIFKNAMVPVENLIGSEGEGRRVLKMYLPSARIGQGVMALGIAEGALDCTIEYIKNRVQFKNPLTDFGEIQFVLAEMTIKAETAFSVLYRVAGMLDENPSEPNLLKYASIAKCYCGDIAMSVTTDAMQLLGSDGYSNDFPVERMMRDAKAYQLMEGTQQIQRLVIARRVLGI